MTPAERAKIAVDGMRLKNDERGRGPSHDEVEELLTRVLEEMQSMPIAIRSPTADDKAAFETALRRLESEPTVVVPFPREYHVGDCVTLSDGTQGVVTLATE